MMQFLEYGNLNYNECHQYSYTTERSELPRFSRRYTRHCLLTQQVVKLATHLCVQSMATLCVLVCLWKLADVCIC
jgi:hypothetical protein